VAFLRQRAEFFWYLKEISGKLNLNEAAVRLYSSLQRRMIARLAGFAGKYWTNFSVLVGDFHLLQRCISTIEISRRIPYELRYNARCIA
jgi:hypothetical protein